MIKRSTLSTAALVGSSLLAALAVANGCSSKTSDSGTADSGPGGGGGYTPIVPPARPTAPATGSTKWFAVKSLKLGITNKATGKADPNAWKDFGYDLDQRNTTEADSRTNNNSCKKIEGAPSLILVDGNGGIDNNFGGHVMATIKSLKSDAEDAVTKSITDGKFTLILKIDNATDTDNASAPGTLYIANDFGSSPTFTSADVWKINGASTTDGSSIDKPKLTFPKGYISNGYWVSGDFGTGQIDLQISLSGASIELPIDSGIITVKLSDGSDGTIAGAMNSDKLKNALTPVAEKFGICPGNATYDQVVATLTQSADLVSGAPNLQDPTRTCDAISIAIGFQMAPTGTPTQVVPPPTSSGGSGCDSETGPGDGGSDAGSGGG